MIVGVNARLTPKLLNSTATVGIPPVLVGLPLLRIPGEVAHESADEGVDIAQVVGNFRRTVLTRWRERDSNPRSLG